MFDSPLDYQMIDSPDCREIKYHVNILIFILNFATCHFCDCKIVLLFHGHVAKFKAKIKMST